MPPLAATKSVVVDVAVTSALYCIFIAEFRMFPVPASSIYTPMASPASHSLFKLTRVVKLSVPDCMVSNVFCDELEANSSTSLHAAANVEAAAAKNKYLSFILLNY